MSSEHLLVFGAALINLVLLNEGYCLDTSTKKYIVSDERMNWDNAVVWCSEQNNQLVELDTYQKLIELRAYIRNTNRLPNNEENGYWLGASFRKKIWLWESSGDEVDDKFNSGWHFGKPSINKLDLSTYTEEEQNKCMELQYVNNSALHQSLSWNDISCTEERRCICKVIIDSDEYAA